jgi:hypothetical protein
VELLKITLLIGRVFSLVALVLQCTAEAQGPAPETAPPLFPKGALFSYSSDFLKRDLPPGNDELSLTSQPTFSHHGNFVFTWGFYPNFDLTVGVPVVTNRFENQNEVGGTGIGDSLILVKYRFYRRDSERGTTQASITAGPKFPTGSTGLSDSAGVRLPASLQPGSGSTDFLLGVNWTYTGLFHIKRLVADEDFRSLLRTTGTQETNLGNDFESRFWLSYRPYESKDVRREWFIGPTITWLHSNDEEIGSIRQNESGGDVLLTGVTTYFGLSPGLHVWLDLEWAVAHSNGENFSPVRRHISIGITRQFRFF